MKPIRMTSGFIATRKARVWRTRRSLFHAGGARGGNLEHQPSGLIWDLDNWMYMSVNTYRLRIAGNECAERTDSVPILANGVFARTITAKLFNINAGYESGPVHYQTPIIYDHDYNYNEDVQFVVRNYQEVYPLVGLADVQGGTPRFRPEDKTLNHFTATCGDEIYRGDRLPADLRGDLLFCEPVGRLICRSKVEVKEGFTRLRNAYDKSEFIRSTDPNFRPGQHGQRAGRHALHRGHVSRHHSGRRLGAARFLSAPGGASNISWTRTSAAAASGGWSTRISSPVRNRTCWTKNRRNWSNISQHPNGWWRDTAQKLLVLRGDKSVVPALIANGAFQPESSGPHSRAVDVGRSRRARILRCSARNSATSIRRSALPRFAPAKVFTRRATIHWCRISQVLAKDPDVNVVMQVLLTADLLKWPDSERVACIHRRRKSGLRRSEIDRSIGQRHRACCPPPVQDFTPEEKKRVAQGGIIYNQLCFTCHGPDGKGTPLQGGKPGETMAPPLERFQDGDRLS